MQPNPAPVIHVKPFVAEEQEGIRREVATADPLFGFPTTEYPEMTGRAPVAAIFPTPV